METLGALEERILQLIGKLHDYKVEVAALKNERDQLYTQVEQLENSLLKNSASVETLTLEKHETNELVQGLISSIEDLLVNHEDRA
jgi:predicted  nucleic acid-binding Zn-ribbon protein